MALELLPSWQMALPQGDTRRVGPYEILETIGHGAMGEVFLARDSRLSRNVAIKTISPEAELDPNRRDRFVQEARAASRLNHPNIVTIHDFGTENGISYIVTELVDGESVRTLVSRGPVPLRKVLDIGIQVADALTAAHDAGIVHRDLKPENIMIAEGGRVKLLDFGVAKPVAAGDPESTLDENHTQPGLLVGTVGYMSPEQARGNAVTVQSDQFAFGVLLNEMITGNHPFRRDTPMNTLIAIANFERPPFTPGPVSFRMLVDRCLAREPAKRFARTSEIQERLIKIRRELPEAPQPKQAKVRWWQKISPRILAFALAGLLFFAVCVVAAARLVTPKIGDPLSYQFTPFPGGHEVAAFPAWAPNGRVIAYSAAQGGVFQVFTQNKKTWLETQVTRSEDDCLFPFWNSDGTRLYYISAEHGQPSLWVVNAAGGTAERVYDNTVRAAQSPDGRYLALLRGPGGSRPHSLWIVPRGGRPKEYAQAPLTAGNLRQSTWLAFSPDNTRLGIWAAPVNGDPALYLVPLDGSPPTRAFKSVTEQPAAGSFEWLPDSRRVLYAGADHLWIGDTGSGRYWRVTNGTAREQFPSVSSTAMEAAFTSSSSRYRLRMATLGGGYTQPPNAVERNELSPVAVKDEYAYVTDRGVAPEVRLRSTDSGWERTLVSAKDFEGSTSVLGDLAISPNRQSIAYYRRGSGAGLIWISALSGEPPARLTRGSHGEERAPAWSPDGNWIAYLGMLKGRPALLKTRVGDGETTSVLVEDAGANGSPAWSPRGDLIAYPAQDSGLDVAPAGGGGSVRRLGSDTWYAAAWTRDAGQILGLVRTGSRRLVLMSLNPDSGAETVVSDLGPAPPALAYATATGASPVTGFSLSRDGHTALFSMLEVHSELWLLRGLVLPGLLGTAFP